MKDYTLSEVASRCIENQTLYNGTVLYDCKNCEFEQICSPTKWGRKVGEIIEPRDMIDLPCKISVRSDNESFWQVAYRGLTRSGIVIVTDFSEESEADAFLADLKGGKR